MGLAQWLASFRDLHERSKAGALAAGESDVYLAAREELARALLAAQRVQTRPGQSPRRAMRVSRALQADLEFQGEPPAKVRAMTLDVSAGGFGALVGRKPVVGEEVRFALRLPGGTRVEGTARVAGVVPGAGNARVSFAFDAITPEDAERLEVLVFDTVLEQMKQG
jgi:c-di-GMP-binding flagellar brake protein YcgR